MTKEDIVDTFFLIMLIVSVLLIMLLDLIFYIGILLKRPFAWDKNIFNNCYTHMKLIKIFSFVFSVLYWFVVSGFEWERCMDGYSKLSNATMIFGRTWIILAFINIIISIVLSISKRGKDEMMVMGRLRKSEIAFGIIFLLISYIIKVG